MSLTAQKRQIWRLIITLNSYLYQYGQREHLNNQSVDIINSVHRYHPVSHKHFFNSLVGWHLSQKIEVTQVCLEEKGLLQE